MDIGRLESTPSASGGRVLCFLELRSIPTESPVVLDKICDPYILPRTIQCLLLDELQSGEPDTQGILPVCATPLEISGFFVPAGMSEFHSSPRARNGLHTGRLTL